MQTLKTFNPPQADRLPILSCIGKIGNVESTYQSDKGYFVTPLTIEPLGAGKSQKVWLTVKPEWIHFGYTPNDQENKAYKNVINNGNLKGDDNLALLQALGGDLDGYSELCTLLDDISVDPEENPDAYGQALNTVLTEWAKEGKTFGYVLKQQVKKNDDTGAWERSKYYKIDRYFYPTEKQLEKERKSAEKQATKISEYFEAKKNGTLEANEDGSFPNSPTPFMVTFDEGLPF